MMAIFKGTLQPERFKGPLQYERVKVKMGPGSTGESVSVGIDKQC